MSKSAQPTCSDCYFRRAGLCALAGETPCPTFRREHRGALKPPRQPQLIAHQPDPLRGGVVAA